MANHKTVSAVFPLAVFIYIDRIDRADKQNLHAQTKWRMVDGEKYAIKNVYLLK